MSPTPTSAAHRPSVGRCAALAAWVIATVGLAPGWCAAQSLAGGATTTVAANAAVPAGGTLSLGLSSNARLTYDPKPWRPDVQLADPAAVPQMAHVGLDFRSTNPNGPKGLLRVQLAGDSALHIRPRSHGLALMYRSQF